MENRRYWGKQTSCGLDGQLRPGYKVGNEKTAPIQGHILVRLPIKRRVEWRIAGSVESCISVSRGNDPVVSKYRVYSDPTCPGTFYQDAKTPGLGD